MKLARSLSAALAALVPLCAAAKEPDPSGTPAAQTQALTTSSAVLTMKTPIMLSPLLVTKDLVTSTVLTTSGFPILRTTWEVEVKNATNAVYPTQAEPGMWKISLTCKHANATPSPKAASKQDTFFGLQPGYSVGRVGPGKFMLDIDSQGMTEGECITCTIVRSVTVGAKTFLNKSTTSPNYCPKPAVPR